nr:MAG TPA: hypothetical protein [Caudoviricetes sp.]
MNPQGLIITILTTYIYNYYLPQFFQIFISHIGKLFHFFVF